MAEEAVVVEEPQAEDVADPVHEVQEPVPEAAVDLPSPPVLEPKKASAMPAIFGGLVAGAIGFGAAYLVLPKADTTLSARVSAQSSEIAGLRDAVAGIPVTGPIGC